VSEVVQVGKYVVLVKDLEFTIMDTNPKVSADLVGGLIKHGYEFTARRHRLGSAVYIHVESSKPALYVVNYGDLKVGLGYEFLAITGLGGRYYVVFSHPFGDYENDEGYEYITCYKSLKNLVTDLKLHLGSFEGVGEEELAGLEEAVLTRLPEVAIDKRW
jgi:hypothetical protein